MKAKVNFIIILITAILSMLAAFAVIYLIVTSAPKNPEGIKGKKVEAKAKKEEKTKIDYKKVISHEIPEMDPINLKPSDKSTKTILKVKVSLLLANEKFAEEFAKREAEVQDIIISTFRDKSGDELENSRMDKLKQEILTKVKELYEEEKEKDMILKVLFDSFFMQ
jgi:flagellar basal body-associated protein FliL